MNLNWAAAATVLLSLADTSGCPSEETVGCKDLSREALVDLEAFPNIAGCETFFQDDMVSESEACATGWHICSVSEFLPYRDLDAALFPNGYRLNGGHGCQVGGCTDVVFQDLPFTGMCGNCAYQNTIWDVETNIDGSDCDENGGEAIFENSSSTENLNTFLQLADNGATCGGTRMGIPTVGALCCRTE